MVVSLDNKIDYFHSLDASPSDIKAFQDWMDIKHPYWVLSNGKYVNLNKGAGYGNFGANTKNAWNIFGKEYISTLNKPATTFAPVNSGATSPAIPSTTNTVKTDKPKKDFSKLKDKIKSAGDLLGGILGKSNSGTPPVSNNPNDIYSGYNENPNEDKKGLSIGAKIGIGAGILIVFGTITYFATRKK